jgi:MurNAc alpha-1-phosphate uridylyltransferase
MNFKFSAMILAAGFGKRMMPLTKELPKPLIKINGITLLDNSIDFLKKLGCNEIIINTHYLYKKINESINKRNDKDQIKLIYENKILDTAGGVKNAASLFTHNNIMVINSVIFCRYENINDVKMLIQNYKDTKVPHLLLSEEIRSFGINKKDGDFILDKNKILRFKKGDKIFYYTGLQILKLNSLNHFSNDKLSFNSVWDYLIDNQKLFGQIMKSNWYHVGDIHGLNIVKQLDT